MYMNYWLFLLIAINIFWGKFTCVIIACLQCTEQNTFSDYNSTWLYRYYVYKKICQVTKLASWGTTLEQLLH